MGPRTYSTVSGKGAQNALDIARDAFATLVTGPAPLALDGRDFPGLPDRSVPLDELRDRLLDGCPPATRDVVWTYLVRRARAAGPAWTVGCVGVAMPALLVVARRLTARMTTDRDDVCAAVLVGFLDRLATVDPAAPRMVNRLQWAAYRAGDAARREVLPGPMPRTSRPRSQPPPVPWEHEDLLLLCAVADGVLNPTETDLIGTTRLDRVRLDAWARTHRLTVAAVYKARARAECRLAAYLQDQPPDVDAGDQAASDVDTKPAPRRSSTQRETSPVAMLSAGGRSPEAEGRPCRGWSISAKKSCSSVSKNRPSGGLQYRRPPRTGSRSEAAVRPCV